MIVFRCSRCSQVNISTEGHHCLHCGNEETQMSSVPENQTEVRSTSTNDNDVFLHMQNKSAGTDFSVLSQAPEKCNVAKLHESDGKDKDTISSSQGEPVRPITQNFVLKETVISPGQSACSNTFYRVDNGRPITLNSILKDIRISRGQAISTKSGASVPTKTLKHISEESYRHMSKNNLPEKKIFEHNQTTKSIQNVKIIGKMNLGCSGPFSPEKSKLDSFTKDCSDVNQLKEKPKYSSCKLLRKTDTSTINNIFQDDKKIRNAFSQRSASSSQEVYREGCSKNYLNGKMPTKSVKTLQKLYLCNKCGKKFNEESAFNVHFLKHFKEKPFKCDRCNKEYFSEIYLKEHYNSHMDKGPFKCDLCELVFIRNCHLSRHRKKHILEPAVDASTAQQKVDLSSQQREQETRGDGNPQKNFETSAVEKIFLCTECGALFICESDFNAHRLKNRKQNAFKCNKCDKQFHDEFYLNMHYRMHTLKRPFTCKICGFSWTQRSNLRKHLKTHPRKIL